MHHAPHALIIALGNVGKARHIGQNDVESVGAQHVEGLAAGLCEGNRRRAQQGLAQRFANLKGCFGIAVDQQKPPAQRVVEAGIHCHYAQILVFRRALGRVPERRDSGSDC